MKRIGKKRTTKRKELRQLPPTITQEERETERKAVRRIQKEDGKEIRPSHGPVRGGIGISGRK